jgi:hypothetical protein
LELRMQDTRRLPIRPAAPETITFIILTLLFEVISKLRLGQASPSMFTPVSGVEGRACHDRFLSFEIISFI